MPVDAGTKDAANQEVRKNESSQRYILLPNWAHDALLESTSSNPYEESSSQVLEGSGNPNSTDSIFNPLAKQMETLIVESLIPTVSLPVPIACLNDSSETSSEARLVSKRVANQEETPSLDDILSLTNRFDDILRAPTSSDEIPRVEADISNMETSISASPTPTHRIHKDHPKSQIIGPVDTPIQTRHKSKMVEEQSFMATIHQKTDPTLLQFCLYSCFLSQVEPKRFWSTTRIETTDEGTHILATVDGIQRTVSEASLRRNLKLRDEDGIVSIPDTELFKNLTLMGFNEFSSNIATALICLATNSTYNFSKMIFDGMVKNVNNKGEGSGTPTESHHTPFPEATLSHPTTSLILLPSIPTAPIPPVTQTGEACPTDSGFIAYQDRATIAKSFTLPHDSAPRVTSPAAEEGMDFVEASPL
nr:hypothetical protein [Tanacetum cinerariifolium]